MTYELVFVLALAIGPVLATLVAGAIARAGFPLPPADRRIGQVDGLRGHLALSVMAHHFYLWTAYSRLGLGWTAPPTNFFNELGGGGVALFFMTTGLVFYPRILKGFAATSWTATYITRVFRIVPLIVVSVIAITLIIVARTRLLPDHHYPVSAAHWVLTLDQRPLIGGYDADLLDAKVLWSLHFEWLFYLTLLPVAAWMMDRARRVGGPSWAVLAVLMVIAVVGRLLHLHDFFKYMPLFLVGMIAFECQKRERIARIARSRLAVPVMVVALLVGMTIASFPYGIAMPAFAVFFICVACGNDLLGILRTGGARVLGECSYSIYVLHGTVLSLLFTEGAGLLHGIATSWLPLVMPLAMATAAAVSAGSYLVVERPAIALGARLARRWGGGRVRLRPAELEVAP